MSGGRPETQRHRGDRFTIVVLPEGPLGEELRDVLTSMSKAGLLIEHALVAPTDVSTSEFGAPKVSGTRLLRGQGSKIDLFATLAEQERRLVRVIDSQVLVTGNEDTASQSSAAEAVRMAVRESMPQSSTSVAGSDSGTNVIGINLMCAVTGLAGQSAKRMKQAWEYNVVVSPEDRVDPGRANVFVRYPGNLAPLAATAITVAGGLLVSIEEGPFDRDLGDASATHGAIRVMRITMRATIGERASDELAREAAREVLHQGNPTQYRPDVFTTARDPRAIISSSLAYFETLDGGVLSETVQNEAKAEPPRQVTLDSGLAAFFRFAWSALAAIPRSLFGSMVSKVERAATSAILGDKSGYAITLRPNVSQDLGVQVQAADEEDRALRRVQLKRIGDLPSPPPSPDLWVGIRQTCTSLLDGGPIADAVGALEEGERRVVLAGPGDIVPHPEDAYDVSSDMTRDVVWGDAPRLIASCDPIAGRAVAAAISHVTAAAAAEVAAAEVELDRVDKALERTRDDDPARSGLLTDRKDTIDALTRAKSRSAKAQREEARLRAWFAARDQALLWRLVDVTANRWSSARDESMQLQESIGRQAGVDLTTPRKLQKRFNRRLVLWLVLLLLAVGATWYRWIPLVGASSYRTAYLGVSIASLMAIASFVWIFTSYYKATLAFLRRFEGALRQRQYALDRFSTVHQRAGRLETCVQQITEWIQVLGYSLHSPWAEPTEPDDLPTNIDREEIPACVQVAEPRFEQERERRAAMGAAALSLCKPGWRDTAYIRLVAEHSGSRDEEEIHEGVRRIDRDPGTTFGPRSQIAQDLKAGSPQRAVTAEVVRTAAESLGGANLRHPNLTLSVTAGSVGGQDEQRAVDFLQGLLTPATPMAQESFSPVALTEGVGAELESFVWLADWFPPSDVPYHLTLVVPPPEIRRQAGLTDVSVRVDVTRPLSPESLRLFSPSRPETLASDLGSLAGGSYT